MIEMLGVIILGCYGMGSVEFIRFLFINLHFDEGVYNSRSNKIYNFNCMGNANANYNNTYNAWLQYRSNIKTSSISSQANSMKLFSMTSPRTSQINVTSNTRPGSNSGQFKQVVSVVPNRV